MEQNNERREVAVENNARALTDCIARQQHLNKLLKEKKKEDEKLGCSANTDFFLLDTLFLGGPKSIQFLITQMLISNRDKKNVIFLVIDPTFFIIEGKFKREIGSIVTKNRSKISAVSILFFKKI